MKPITFFVPGEPKGQPRPRAFARKMGDKFVARVFDAATAEGWKGAIAAVAQPLIKEPMTGPIRLTLSFVMPRPKKHYRGIVLRAEAPIFHTIKPDNDNLQKAVMDALTRLGAWKDDSQVADLASVKLYGEAPGCRITIEEAA